MKQREIKFRAWDKKHQEMYEITELFFTDKARVGGCKDYPKNSTMYDEDFTIMQFTNLKDKNGKEIFEGDLFEVMGQNKEIYFELGTFWLDGIPFHTIYDEETFEVIGNIYENPELLK